MNFEIRSWREFTPDEMVKLEPMSFSLNEIMLPDNPSTKDEFNGQEATIGDPMEDQIMSTEGD